MRRDHGRLSDDLRGQETQDEPVLVRGPDRAVQALEQAPALSFPPKSKEPSLRPSTNHLKPTGTSTRRRPSCATMTTPVASTNKVIRPITAAKRPSAGARVFSIIAWMAWALSLPTTPWISVTSLPWAASCPNTKAATAMRSTQQGSEGESHVICNRPGQPLTVALYVYSRHSRSLANGVDETGVGNFSIFRDHGDRLVENVSINRGHCHDYGIMHIESRVDLGPHQGSYSHRERGLP